MKKIEIVFTADHLYGVVRQNLIADRNEDRTRKRPGLLGVVVLGVPYDLALAESVLPER